jgi:hypothetical protein
MTQTLVTRDSANIQVSQNGGRNWDAKPFELLQPTETDRDDFKVTLVVGGCDTVLAATKRLRTLDNIFTHIFNKIWWRYCLPGVNYPLYPTFSTSSWHDVSLCTMKTYGGGGGDLLRDEIQNLNLRIRPICRYMAMYSCGSLYTWRKRADG